MTVVILVLFFSSFLLTILYRHYALARNVIDLPNHRSSHIVPTPRGGGMSFVVVFLIYLLVLRHEGMIDKWDVLGFFVPGLCVAGLGFIDDHRPIPALGRLLVHFIASSFAILCLGSLASVEILAGSSLTVIVLMTLFTLFYLVWCLNLYNFMDGIDGLAALEGICVCVGGALIYWLQGYTTMIVLPLAMAASVAGFLCWNFPVARIFMGDAGSGFLGLIIGLFSIQASHVDDVLFLSWIILSGVFITDATITLILRVLKGHRAGVAHRDHIYQRATDCFQRHVKVTTGVVVINLIWLLPIAVLVGARCLNGLTGVLMAYLPLIVLVVLFQDKD